MSKKKLCSYPACGNYVIKDTYYCEKHASFYKHKEEQLKKKYNFSHLHFLKRNQNKQSKQWKRIRDAYIVEHPNCIICGKIAVLVDHILARQDGGTDDEYNLQSMCLKCHIKKTRHEVADRKVKSIVDYNGDIIDVSDGKNRDKRWDI